MGRVFILNYAGHDTTPAEEFSKEIIKLTVGNLHIFDVDRVRYDLKINLEGNRFNPEEDFLVLSGNLILGFIIGNLITALDYPKVKLLLWDANKKKYLLRDFVLRNGG